MSISCSIQSLGPRRTQIFGVMRVISLPMSMRDPSLGSKYLGEKLHDPTNPSAPRSSATKKPSSLKARSMVGGHDPRSARNTYAPYPWYVSHPQMNSGSE